MIYKVYKDPLYIQCEGVVQEPESQVAEAAKRGEGPGAEVKGRRGFKWRDFKWQDFGGNRPKFGQISRGGSILNKNRLRMKRSEA